MAYGVTWIAHPTAYFMVRKSGLAQEHTRSVTERERGNTERETWQHFSVSDVASRAVIHRLLWHRGIYQLELAPLVISRSGLLSEVLISSHRTGVRNHNNDHNCKREWVGPASQHLVWWIGNVSKWCVTALNVDIVYLDKSLRKNLPVSST